MKDSELLGLLDRAQERQRGEKGEPGTGIDRIEQFDDESFTIKLTTGESRKISLPIAKDGEVGPTGSVGPRGPEGAAGKPGRDGASATDGQPGPQGLPGVSLSTAVVNDSGELLLQLSDGVIINVGRVRGPAGATGGQGATGLPGNPGRDGKQMLSGPRTPTQDDGEEGDHWIDVSDTSFALFKKDGGGWTKIADLRQIVQPRAVSAPGGGGGGGAGGGKGEPQNTRTLPLFNPTGTRKSIPATLPDPGALLTQEDANKYLLRAVQNAMVFVGEFPPNPAVTTEGQLWWCTADDDLTLYIFTGTEWVAASPPVSLDGVQSAIASIDEQLLKVNANVAMNKSELDEKALDIQLDQDRQDAEIQELHEKVNGIAEEFDRGKWAHVTEKPTVGQYALAKKVNSQYCQDEYLKCVEAAGDDAVAASKCLRGMEACEAAATEDPDHMVYVDHWGGVDHIAIHTEEADGEMHGFGDYTVGKYIEIINEGDEGNATYLITEDATIENGVAIVTVSDIQATGAPNGLGRFKVFEMKSGDPTDYVKKTGDKMTGQLSIRPTKETTTGFVCYAPSKLPDDNSLSFAAFVNGQDKVVMEIKNNGQIWLGDRNFEYTPTKDKSLVNKKYVDEKIAKVEKDEDETNARLFGSPYIFRQDKKAKDLASGEFTYDSDWNWFAHRYDATGDRIGVSSDNTFTIDGMLKIYKHNGAINLICVMHRYKSCKCGQENNDYMKWEKKASIYTHMDWIEDGQIYYLSDSFLLP